MSDQDQPTPSARGDLEDLLRGAASASAHDRVTFRDPIAAHGVEGIRGVAAWLEHDVPVAWFAVAVIEAAARGPARAEALSALTRAEMTATGGVRRDIEAALRRLGVRPATPVARSGQVRALARSAGLTWPGFQDHEFGRNAGTRWRNRDGAASLAPIITRGLRYQDPRFESYGVERSPEVHFALAGRYRADGEPAQGWRAGKLFVYAFGPTDERPDTVAHVAAGLLIERPNEGAEEGPLDDRWDWPWLLRACGTSHVRDELSRVMVRHELSVGQYIGQRFDPSVDGDLGFVGRIEEGELVLRDRDTAVSIARGWDAFVERLEQAPPAYWYTLSIWRTWPAAEALRVGQRFATSALQPVIHDLASVYLDIIPTRWGGRAPGA